jgi:hypothetical protein
MSALREREREMELPPCHIIYILLINQKDNFPKETKFYEGGRKTKYRILKFAHDTGIS